MKDGNTKGDTMFIYQQFIKELIGSKRNSWTFVNYKRIKRGAYYTTIIMCQCDCGRIQEYTISLCRSKFFAQQCRICTKKRIKDKWEAKRAISDQINKNKFDDMKEEESIVDDYADFYKRYFRD